MPRKKKTLFQKFIKKHLKELKKGEYTSYIFRTLFLLLFIVLGTYAYSLSLKNDELGNKYDELKKTQIILLEKQLEVVSSLEEDISFARVEFGEAQLELKDALELARTDLSAQIIEEENRVGEVIKEWRPRIARLKCENPTDPDGSPQKGSGTLFKKNNEIFILTNSHVLQNNKKTSVSCEASFLDSENTKISFSSEDFVFGDEKLDFAKIVVNTPTTYMQDVLKKPLFECSTKATTGEKIVIVGYPAIGDRDDVTATDGIISGYDDEHYITSAKIERGHSGSAGISLKQNCYLGIPTFVRAGSIESLGRILDIQEIKFN